MPLGIEEEKMSFNVNQIFEGEYPPEAAIWCNRQGNCYIQEIDSIEGKRCFQIQKKTEPSIEELRSAKLEMLEAWFLYYRTAKTTFVESSLGFKANSNSTAYMDVDGLIGILEAQKEIGQENPTVIFMDFENAPHELTVENMKTLKNEISANGTRAYEVKWALRDKINAAQSKEELDAVVINFDQTVE